MMKKSIIRRLKSFSENSSIPIDKMILFGSQAWGKAHKADRGIEIV